MKKKHDERQIFAVCAEYDARTMQTFEYQVKVLFCQFKIKYETDKYYISKAVPCNFAD